MSSDKFFRFASINHADKIAYEFDADHWDYRNRGYGVADFLRQYDTYGDGMTAHSPSYSVAKENFADVCASLAKHIAEGNCTDEQLKKLSWKVCEEYKASEFEFFAKLKYNADGKKQYVNLTEKKKSTADSKRHDKRWTEVVEWMNGSVDAIYALVCQRHGISEFINQFHAYLQVQEWCGTQDIHTGKEVAEYFEIHGGDRWNDRKRNKLAFQALQAVVEQYRKKKEAENAIGDYIETMAEFRRAEAEKQTA